MPPSLKITKDAILEMAVCIVREQGGNALNARSLAQRLGCSTQPIFSNYENMDMLRQDVLHYAWGIYNQYMQKEIASGKYPDYKSSGLAYIRFAKDEQELFKLLFMCSRTTEEATAGEQDIRDIIDIIQRATGFSEELAKLFHLEMWTFVHGVAVMLVTSYLNWDWNFISDMLTDVYQGLLKHFADRK